MGLFDISFLLHLAALNHLVLLPVSLLRAHANSAFATVSVLGVQWVAALSALPNLIYAAIYILQVA